MNASEPQCERNLAGNPSRRGFLTAGLTAAMLAPSALADAPPAAPDSFELDELTIADLQEGMQSGKWSAQALVAKYLERIEAVDRQGPHLKSVVELNPDAESIARERDQERNAGRVRGQLHGIPVLLKENVDTSDRLATTAGSLALTGARPPRDAHLVQRLRDAGAVILGKTNLSEWANIRSSHSTSGWSARGGLTRNPYALDRNPSGSSSGSAVAVAANLCAVAVGTETDGSILSPSSINGLVGIKPTLGLVGRSGIIPIAHSQDTAGPMARTVHDAALLLTALAGADPGDAATNASVGKTPPDYARFLDPRGLKGARLGVVRQFCGIHDDVDALMEEVLLVLRKEGATVIDPAKFAPEVNFDETEMTVLLYELKADLNAYLERLGPAAPVRSLADVIAFNENNRQKEMPYFGQDLFIQAESKGPLTDAAYQAALTRNHHLAREVGIDALMDRHGLDALIGPTEGPAWLTDLVNGDHFLGRSTTIAAVAGYPSITVPAGFVRGLPIGLSFFGRAWSEPTLIRLAYAFEQATKVRKPPRFLATVEGLA